MHDVCWLNLQLLRRGVPHNCPHHLHSLAEQRDFAQDFHSLHAAVQDVLLITKHIPTEIILETGQRQRTDGLRALKQRA